MKRKKKSFKRLTLTVFCYQSLVESARCVCQCMFNILIKRIISKRSGIVFLPFASRLVRSHWNSFVNFESIRSRLSRRNYSRHDAMHANEESGKCDNENVVDISQIEINNKITGIMHSIKDHKDLNSRERFQIHFSFSLALTAASIVNRFSIFLTSLCQLSIGI